MLNQPPLYLTINIRTGEFGFAELGGLNHANVTYRQFSKTVCSFVFLFSLSKRVNATGCELFLVNTKTQSEELIAMDDKPAKLKRSISASGSGKFMLKSKVKTDEPKSSTIHRSSKAIDSPASSPQLNR